MDLHLVELSEEVYGKQRKRSTAFSSRLMKIPSNTPYISDKFSGLFIDCDASFVRKE